MSIDQNKIKPANIKADKISIAFILLCNDFQNKAFNNKLGVL